MSRSKDIELIHQFTGWSYKESRRRYHESGHSISRTLMIDSDSVNALLDSMNQATKALVDAASKMAKAIMDAINEIDWKQLTELAKQMKESQHEDFSDNSI